MEIGKLNKDLAKKIAAPIVLGLLFLLAFKFFMWNSWKVERASALAQAVMDAPPAVNLTIKKTDGQTVQRRSFSFNPDGNYYEVTSFTHLPTDLNLPAELPFRFWVGGRLCKSVTLYRFRQAHLLETGSGVFVFPIKMEENIDSYARFRRSLRLVTESLAALALYHDNNEDVGKKVHYRVPQFKGNRNLTIDNNLLNASLLVNFQKDRVYELSVPFTGVGFELETIEISISGSLNLDDDTLFKHQMRLPAQDGNLIVLFSPAWESRSPQLFLKLKRKGLRRGRTTTRITDAVTGIRDVVIYQYPESKQWPGAEEQRSVMLETRNIPLFEKQFITYRRYKR